MKNQTNKFLFYLKIIFLLFFLYSCDQKEYVKDFKVENIGVGDSLLTYFSEEDILEFQRTKDIMGNPIIEELYIDSMFENYNFETYEKLQIYYKRSDKEYIIHAVGGAIFYGYDNEKCKKKLFEVRDLLNEQYKTPIVNEYLDTPDETEGMGNTIYSEIFYDFENGESISIGCNDYDNELLNVQDYFNLMIYSEEINNFYATDALDQLLN